MSSVFVDRVLYEGKPMPRYAWALMLLAASTGFADEEIGRVAAKKGWRFDYTAARNEAKAKNLPMMVVFRCQP